MEFAKPKTKITEEMKERGRRRVEEREAEKAGKTFAKSMSRITEEIKEKKRRKERE